MLHAFITANRAEIVARCRARIESRPSSESAETDGQFGVPLFVDQLSDALRAETDSKHPRISDSAARNARELLQRGFTIAQVVHDYGGVCQSITELATEHAETITPLEFKAFNMCLDDAIAAAVTEYSRLREDEGTARAGYLAHELRNLLESATLAFEVLKTGSVGIGGSTGGVLGSSLVGLRELIDRELTQARLVAGIHRSEDIVVRELIDQLKVAAMMHAQARRLEFSVRSVEGDVRVHADRQIINSVLTNLLHNAFKFTRRGGRVSLHARATVDRVFIDVEDECGGLPPGKTEELFLPYEQRGADQTGLGIGLDLCRRGAEVHGGSIQVEDHPGTGCVFTLTLPRQQHAEA